MAETNPPLKTGLGYRPNPPTSFTPGASGFIPEVHGVIATGPATGGASSSFAETSAASAPIAAPVATEPVAPVSPPEPAATIPVAPATTEPAPAETGASA